MPPLSIKVTPATTMESEPGRHPPGKARLVVGFQVCTVLKLTASAAETGKPAAAYGMAAGMGVSLCAEGTIWVMIVWAMMVKSPRAAAFCNGVTPT